MGKRRDRERPEEAAGPRPAVEAAVRRLRALPAAAAEDAADVYWKGVVSHTPDGGARRVDLPAFVAALEAAREDGTLRSMVKPTVRAHLAVADQDGDGVVDAGEFAAAQQALGIPEDRARDAFTALDVDGDGRLTLAEWENAVWDFYTGTDPDGPGGRVLGHP